MDRHASRTASIPPALLVAAIVALTAPAAVVAQPPAPNVTFEEQRIEFAPGTDNATREGFVDPDNSDRWILRANAGQAMDVTVDSADENTVFSVFAPGHVLLANVVQGTTWSGTLPAAGDYAVEVASVGDLAYYQLKVWIDATVRDPLGSVQRMAFAPGADAGTADGEVVRGSADTWVLGAAAGQTMHVSVVSVQDNASVDVFAPDGLALTAQDDQSVWRGQLPQNGDYHVVVQPTFGNATYTITVQITGAAATPPPAAQPPQAASRRISFPPGTDNLTVSDQIGPGETQRWLAGAAAGQTMWVSLQSDTAEVSFNLYGPDGAPLAGDRLNAGPDEVTASGDHVIAVINAGDNSGTYILTVVIR